MIQDSIQQVQYICRGYSRWLYGYLATDCLRGLGKLLAVTTAADLRPSGNTLQGLIIAEIWQGWKRGCSVGGAVERGAVTQES